MQPGRDKEDAISSSKGNFVFMSWERVWGQKYYLLDKAYRYPVAEDLLNLYKLAIQGFLYNKFLILSILREIPVVDCKAAYTDSALLRRILCGDGAAPPVGSPFAR